MKKAINICKDEAESIQHLKEDECLISVHNTTNAHWDLKVEGERVLKVFFDDVPHPLVHAGKKYTPIDVDQAHQIFNFIKKYKDNNFYINCHAGIARSGAIALFAHLFFGHDLKKNFWQTSHPNNLVLGMLTSEYCRNHFKYENIP